MKACKLPQSVLIEYESRLGGDWDKNGQTPFSLNEACVIRRNSGLLTDLSSTLAVWIEWEKDSGNFYLTTRKDINSCNTVEESKQNVVH